MLRRFYGRDVTCKCPIASTHAPPMGTVTCVSHTHNHKDARTTHMPANTHTHLPRVSPSTYLATTRASCFLPNSGIFLPIRVCTGQKMCVIEESKKYLIRQRNRLLGMCLIKTPTTHTSTPTAKLHCRMQTGWLAASFIQGRLRASDSVDQQPAKQTILPGYPNVVASHVHDYEQQRWPTSAYTPR